MAAVNVDDIADIYELSPLQQGLLFHSLYAPGSETYVVQFACALQGDVDIPAFRRAWQRLLERHDAFRTSFHATELRQPLQVVHHRVDVPWREEDWRGLPKAEREARREAFLAADRAAGFDPAAAPLMRLTIFRMTEDSYWFTWTHHHLLIDGWSLGVVLGDLQRLYSAFRRGEEAVLPPVRPYRDYVAWLQEQDPTAAEAFWRGQLRGVTAPTGLSISRQESGPAGSNARYGERRIELTPALTAALGAVARQAQVTLNTVVQGAWALLLSHYAGSQDVLFGVTVSGRPPDLPGVEQMVGCFINTLPARVQVPGAALLRPWLQGLQAQQAEARQYEFSALVDIQGWSAVPRDTPLFETLLVFENYPIAAALDGDADHDPILLAKDLRVAERTNYPLTLAVAPATVLGLRLLYDRGRVSEAASERLLDHFVTLLAAIAANPERRLAAMPLLPAWEQRRLVVEWNQTALAAEAERSITQLVAEQARRRPQAPAVVTATSVLSYADLDRQANRLAHRLQRLGVGPDRLVGVLLERSSALIVAQLAILKAGGAYLPLDPALPPERLAAMLADAHAVALLTRAALAEPLPAVTAAVIYLEEEELFRDTEPAACPSEQAGPDHLAYVIYTSGSTGRPKG
ncbi:MAG TPA: condensation domain-containing protein, partial [Chloroflexota bacterium]|nr:condensation domain-containing protein [Chloroflexota bacterium]